MKRDESPEQISLPSTTSTAGEDETDYSTGGADPPRDRDMAEEAPASLSAAAVAAVAAAAASSASSSGPLPPPPRPAPPPAPEPPRVPPPVPPPPARRRRRVRDVVLLNVGGTVFTTSAATLTAGSSYFKSMFSDRWSGPPSSAPPEPSPPASDDDDDAVPRCPRCRCADRGRDPPPRQRHPDPIFIDQDARPFSLLLTYMRGGGINLLESDVPLARQVMLQAQFFGAEGFLRTVKARSYRHNHPDFAGDDDEAVSNFERDYGGIDAAICDGTLPEAYFRPMPDHVVINAGGTTFETSKRTLTERSPYFESLFKRSPRERTYFLDVDPGAFSILLKYMRHAEFDLPRDDVALFRCTLALAQRFEIRGFIEYVKARTYAIQSGHDPREWLTFLDRHHHPIEDSDNADAFNENYEGIDEAFVTGMLPDGFFEKKDRS